MADIERISAFLQERLKAEGLPEVSAVDAALWLDEAGILGDSQSKPGLPLRNILRRVQRTGQLELIAGAYQEPSQRYGRWYIRRV